MTPSSPPHVPPATAEYTSALQPPKPRATPVQSAFRLHRSGDGKTRVDSGNTSVISDPAAGHTIVLDHMKKTALVQPTPPKLPKGAAPQTPQAGPLPFQGLTPHTPGVQAQDLGKSMFQGHEVEGKRYVFQPPTPPKTPAVPKTPQMPGMPKAPQIPGMPKAPQMAGMPKAPQVPGAPAPPAAPAAPGAPPLPQTPKTPQKPQMPTTVETWTSTSMRLPMATKMTGSFGQVTQTCHSVVPGEPHPSAFQIPPGYKTIVPPKPPAFKPPALKPPALAALKPSAMPKLKPPAMPKLNPPLPGK